MSGADETQSPRRAGAVQYAYASYLHLRRLMYTLGYLPSNIFFWTRKRDPWHNHHVVAQQALGVWVNQ
jgi:hypothetical protein